MSGNRYPRLAFFPPDKPTPECVPLAHIVMGSPLTEAQRQHVATCDDCNKLVSYEAAARQDERFQKLPPNLLAALTEVQNAPRRERHWAWTIAPVATLALAAAVLFTVRTTPRDTYVEAPLIKGAATVIAVVQRDGVNVPDADFDKVGPLLPGDVVRLRVNGETHGAACIQEREGARWNQLFTGPVPADRFFPVAFKVTAEPMRRVRVTLCDESTPASAVCSEEVPTTCYRAELRQ